ncbi:MAG: hypothetical protein Q8P25_03525 [Candidatus Curtissbacteria bacterium]|nr:hypothetical protein [Candidatus Curtissbacteria bacterium]
MDSPDISPSKEANPNSFSGKVRLPTRYGVIEIDIKDAEVLRGRDILEDCLVPPVLPKDETPRRPIDYNQALFNLGRTFDDMHEFDRQLPYRPGLSWQDLREGQISQYGEESIFTLLPDQHRKPGIIRISNILLRNGIYTKGDLMNRKQKLKNAGPSAMKVLNAIKDVISAQSRMSADAIPSEQKPTI